MPEHGKPHHLPFDKKVDMLWLGDGWHSQFIDLKKRIPYDLFQRFDKWNRRLGFLLRAFDPNDETSHNRELQRDILQEAVQERNMRRPHPALLASGFVNLEWLSHSRLLNPLKLHQ